MFEAQLAQPLNLNKIDQYVKNDNWWFEQKLDGIRLGLVIEDGEVVGWNRRGNRVNLKPAVKEPFEGLNKRWVLDGELIDERYYIFDLLEGQGNVLHAAPYSARRAALETVYHRIVTPDTRTVFLLQTHRTVQEKADLTAWCKKNGAEGIMVKNADGLYHPGLRSPDMLKAKFVKTVDAVVSEVGRKGKQAVGISVYDDSGTLVEICGCKVTERVLNQIMVGDVVEIRYLYATADNRIYQPCFLRFRDDKDAVDCTIDQLEYTSKEVRVA